MVKTESPRPRKINLAPKFNVGDMSDKTLHESDEKYKNLPKSSELGTTVIREIQSNVETNNFDPERAEFQPVSARVCEEPVGVVLARAPAPSTLPNAPLDEVGDAGLKVKPNEGTLSGGGEPVASRGPMGLIRNKLRDSMTRKEDGGGSSITTLSRLLNMAAGP